MREEALSEITLRKYEKPYNLNQRELAKKICLSLGLLQDGDSRDVIVDIVITLIEAKKKKQALSLEEIKNKVVRTREFYILGSRGIADSNLRRQLRKLKDLFIVESESNLYKISEFESLENLFEKKIEKFYIVSIVERIKEYLKELEKSGSE